MSEKNAGAFKKLLKFIKYLTEYNVTAKVSAEEQVGEQNGLTQAWHKVAAASPPGWNSALELSTQHLNFGFEASFSST